MGNRQSAVDLTPEDGLYVLENKKFSTVISFSGNEKLTTVYWNKTKTYDKIFELKSRKHKNQIVYEIYPFNKRSDECVVKEDSNGQYNLAVKLTSYDNYSCNNATPQNPHLFAFESSPGGGYRIRSIYHQARNIREQYLCGQLMYKIGLL